MRTIASIKFSSMLPYSRRGSDIVAHRHGIEKTRRLKGDADRPLHDPQFRLVHRRDILILVVDAARRGPDQPAHVFQQGRFSASAAANDDKDLTAFYGKRDIVQYLRVPVVGHQVLHLDNGICGGVRGHGGPY